VTSSRTTSGAPAVSRSAALMRRHASRPHAREPATGLGSGHWMTSRALRDTAVRWNWCSASTGACVADVELPAERGARAGRPLAEQRLRQLAAEPIRQRVVGAEDGEQVDHRLTGGVGGGTAGALDGGWR